jgi:hypothetical protein
MALRMLCIDCLHVGEPDTVLDGSDRVELIAWCCGVLPGLVYCWWRHLCRFKVCGQCGSDTLMRESRAAAARHAPQARPATGSRIWSTAGLDFRWPLPLCSPRERLRSGAIGSSLLAFACGAWLLGAFDLTSHLRALQVLTCGGVLAAVWLAWQVHQIARRRSVLGDCRAWDDRGRMLRIERV